MIFQTIQSAVDEFKNEIGYGGAIKIDGPYDAYNDPRGEIQYPLADEPGCYVFASEAGSILYVGKGSRTMGRRMWEVIGRKAKRVETEVFPDAKTWFKNHKPEIWAVSVEQRHWWLAPALEGFLFETLRPSENKQQR